MDDVMSWGGLLLLLLLGAILLATLVVLMLLALRGLTPPARLTTGPLISDVPRAEWFAPLNFGERGA
jgi:hypothetical protein